MRVIAVEPISGGNTFEAFFYVFFPVIEVATSIAVPYLTKESG